MVVSWNGVLPIVGVTVVAIVDGFVSKCGLVNCGVVVGAAVVVSTVVEETVAATVDGFVSK